MASRSRAAIALCALLLGACRRGEPVDAPATEGGPAIRLGVQSDDGRGASARATEIAPRAPTVSEPWTVRLVVGGDLLPHRPTLARTEGIEAALEPLRPLFLQADRVVLNFEGAILPEGKAPDDDPMVLGVTPQWVAAVGRAGVSGLSFANNHACDGGERGLLRGLAVAQEQGIVSLGADPDDPWEARVLADRGGRRLCAVSWTTFMNGKNAACANSPLVAQAFLGPRGAVRSAKAVARAKAAGCDAIVAIVHGGDEYVGQIGEMKRAARRAADAGADAVVIHHPHVPSPVLVHGTRDGRTVPIFASVGNLVSNQGASWKVGSFPRDRADRRRVALNAWTRLGVLADLVFRFDDAGKHVEWASHLTWTDNAHAQHPEAAAPEIRTRLLDPRTDAELVESLRRDEEGPLALFTDPCWQEASGHRCSAAPAERRAAHPRSVARVTP